MYDYNDEFYKRHAPGLCMAIININKFVLLKTLTINNSRYQNMFKEYYYFFVPK